MGLEKLLEETAEAYYWIGFLMADGNIDTHGYANRLTVFLSEKDKDHIYAFAKFVNVPVSTRAVKTVETNLGTIRSKKQYGVRKNDKENVRKIIEKFDFKNRKTYNPPRIDIKNDKLFASFLIGYIDGDGSIGKNRITIECHSSWGDLLSEMFGRIWKDADCKILNKTMSIPNHKIYGKSAAIGTSDNRFLQYLIATIADLNLPVLKRKWDKIRVKQHNHYSGYENKLDVIELYKSGLSTKQISEMKHISKIYVQKIVFKYNNNLTLLEGICQKTKK